LLYQLINTISRLAIWLASRDILRQSFGQTNRHISHRHTRRLTIRVAYSLAAARANYYFKCTECESCRTERR